MGLCCLRCRKRQPRRCPSNRRLFPERRSQRRLAPAALTTRWAAPAFLLSLPRRDEWADLFQLEIEIYLSISFEFEHELDLSAPLPHIDSA